jgi:outer membrane protein assembly factor BamE (lipoprotein component of BamABCDE complex)
MGKFAAFWTLLLLAGCASSGTMVTEQQAAQFERGVTIRDQVIAKLGQPNSTTLSSDGTRVDAYVHVHASVNGATFIPVVGLMAGGSKADSNIATFTYDERGVLKAISTTTGHSQVNTGLLNQK